MIFILFSNCKKDTAIINSINEIINYNVACINRVNCCVWIANIMNLHLYYDSIKHNIHTNYLTLHQCNKWHENVRNTLQMTKLNLHSLPFISHFALLLLFFFIYKCYGEKQNKNLTKNKQHIIKFLKKVYSSI